MLRAIVTRPVIRGSISTRSAPLQIGVHAISRKHSPLLQVQPTLKNTCTLSTYLSASHKSTRTRSIAPFATQAGTQVQQESSKPLKAWTPTRDAKLLEWRKARVPWARISNSTEMPVIECKLRYQALVDSQTSEKWSTTLQKSTATEKSVPELERLVLEGKSWSEISDIMNCMGNICVGQWSFLGDRYLGSGTTYFSTSKMWGAIESGRYNLNISTGILSGSPAKSLLGVDLYDWGRMAKEIYRSVFSPEYIRYRFATIGRNQARWSEDDKQLLIDYLRENDAALSDQIGSQGSSSLELDWHEVSRNVFSGRHSPYSCRTRWVTDFNSIKIPPSSWTAAEILEYWDAWAKEGEDWTAIASSIHSGDRPRTPRECQQDHTFIIKTAEALRRTGDVVDMNAKFLNTATTPTNFVWMPEHDAKLLRVVQEETAKLSKTEDADVNHGGQNYQRRTPWGQVAERLGFGASTKQCSRRWRLLTENSPPLSSSSSTTSSKARQPVTHAQRLTGENVQRLSELVDKERPSGLAAWKQFKQAHFPGASVSKLLKLWSDFSVKEMTDSKASMEELERLTLQHGEHSWATVAVDMSRTGHYRTQRQCRRAWDTRQLQTQKHWSPEELDRLSKVPRYLEPGVTDDPPKFRDFLCSEDSIMYWLDVSKQFPSKTAVQCFSKWNDLNISKNSVLNIDWNDTPELSPAAPATSTLTSLSTADHPEQLASIRPTEKFRWTPESIEILTRMVDKYGRKVSVFNQVAKMVGTHSASSCQGRWDMVVRDRQRLRNPVKSPLFLWNPEQDKILIETMAEARAKGWPNAKAFKTAAMRIEGCPTYSPGPRWWRLERKAKAAAESSL